MIYAAAILVFLIFWILISAVFIMLMNNEKPIDKLKYFDDNYEITEGSKDNKKDRISILKSLSSLVPKFKFNRKIEIELVKADIPVTVEELLVIKILSSSALSFFSFAVSRDYFITVVVFILVWNIPRFIISKRKKDKIKLFESQLGDSITIISNSLKAGYSFLQSVAVVSKETEGPISIEFEKLLKEMSLGIPEEDALKNMLNRIESDDLKLITNAILIQKDIGGNLSEILDNISDTIRERQKIKDELKTLTAQGKLSGAILMLIPVFLGMIIYMFNKDYVMLLFTTSIGLAMIAAAVVCEILGFIVIKKIINIEI